MRVSARYLKMASIMLASACVGVLLTLGIISYDKICLVTCNMKEMKRKGMEALYFQEAAGDQPSQHSQVSQYREQTKCPSVQLVTNNDPKHENKEAYQRMQNRRQLINQTCMNNRNMTQLIINAHRVYSKKYSVFYCPVEKTASTFWRRFFYQLEYTDPVRSPFEVGIAEAYAAMSRFKLPEQDDGSVKTVPESAYKMMFVRDPYSRLYSAYVDKLVAPNPFYWTQWGKPAIIKSRNISDQGKNRWKHCGHDVTFQEFIHEALDSIWKKDVHVTPIIHLCMPCSISYDVIGKMETFMDDTKLLVNNLGIDPAQLRLEAMKNDSVADAIEDSATDALSASWLQSSLKCINMDAVVRRIWRKLQLRGFISWRRTFPLTHDQMKRLRAPNFIRILKKESALSTNEQELKLQKKQGMMEAFASLAPSDFADIEKIFGMDFQLFGFNISTFKNVGTLKAGVKNTYAFDWWKDWDMSSIL